MGKTYKESHFPGSKQSGKAAEYQSKKKVRHSKMQPYKRERAMVHLFLRCLEHTIKQINLILII